MQHIDPALIQASIETQGETSLARTQPNSSWQRPAASVSNVPATRRQPEPEVLEVMSNYLMLNPKAISPESVAAWALVLSRFPATEVRAALATCAHQFPTQVQLDVILRTLADRLWKSLKLAPPTDIAIAEVWRKIWDYESMPPVDRWSHPAVYAAVKRFGWRELYGQEIETDGVRRAQMRTIYDAEREREISLWIAEVSLVTLGPRSET